MQDDLIALAKQAGIEYKRLPDSYCASVCLPYGTVGTVEIRFEQFRAFADLIRQEEREKCAQWLDTYDGPINSRRAEAIRAGITDTIIPQKIADYKGFSGDPISSFKPGQWWVRELEEAVSEGTPDQKRAMAALNNLLKTIQESFQYYGKID